MKNTEKFTDLKYFIVEDKKTLTDFEKVYRAGGIEGYDMIFVKIGRVTSTFTIAGEPKQETKQRSLLAAFGMVLEGVTVARLVIDDFDPIKLSSDDYFIPASFTWTVSATRRKTNTGVRVQSAPNCLHPTPQDFLRANHSKFSMWGQPSMIPCMAL